MKLSISNIAWDETKDTEMLSLLVQQRIEGLEIAPTRIIPASPYDHLSQAQNWAQEILTNYGLEIPSMQSIWYGRSENMFSSPTEQAFLLAYTKKAIDFARAIHCKNLVFGCPRNRNVPAGKDTASALTFFQELGDYAYQNGTVIGIEANPTLYHTNYLNTTADVIALVKHLKNPGIRLNLDLGTMLTNIEDLRILQGNVTLISHVHISEPQLKPIQQRKLHKELFSLLKAENYSHYISLEMGKVNDPHLIENRLHYLKGIIDHDV